MEQINNLPKHFPLWHDITTQCCIQNKKYNRFASDRLPDFAGIGIDITSDKGELRCDIPKHGIDQVHFGAKVCALPFFPDNKVSLEIDPCLSGLRAQKQDFEEFCMKLDCARKYMNFSYYEKYKNDILSSQKKIRNMCSSKQFKKILVPKNIVALASKFPQSCQVPEINFGYSGGCLSKSQMIDGNPILLHPVGDKLNVLALTPLEETCEINKVFKPTISARSTVKLKDGYIQQIKSAISGYCYVKQEKLCHFVNFTNKKVLQSDKCLHDCNITNIAASPYIPTEFISITENGKVFLNDVDTRGALWETDFFFPDQYATHRPLACDFGSNPKSLLYLANKELYCFDLRSTSNKNSTILCCDNASCYVDETFLAVKGSTVNPFQHLVFSNYHLFLSDERYPKKPVLIWNHLLKGSPIYCDIASYDTNPDSSDVVVLLGTQESRELVSFAVRSRHSQDQPVSLSPPMFLSSPSDWADSLKFHGFDIEDDVIRRLSFPLAGICAVSHSNKPAFTAFQITSVGELFYQDFQTTSDSKAERTYRVDMGCVLPPPERIFPHLSQWNDTSNETGEEDSSLKCNLKRVIVDMRNILKVPKEISDWCVMCRSINRNSENKVVSSEICPSCGLENLQSDNLQKRCNELSLFIGPLLESPELESFDTEEFKQFSDQYSRKILEPWISLEDIEIRTPPWDHEFNYSFATMSPVSNTSYSNFATPVRNLNTSTQLDFTNLSTQLSSQSLFTDEIASYTPMCSQESTEDFITPRQEVRSKVGETLKRKTRKSKIPSQMNTSSAGF